MTSHALFRDDSYLTTCSAKIAEITEDGAYILDQTIFYPTGGGQLGDSGFLENSKGEKVIIATTRNDRERGAILHIPEETDAPVSGFAVGDEVVCHIDWKARYKFMRLHTALHLLSVVLPYPVTGGQIGKEEARLDFNIPDPSFTKEELTSQLMSMVEADYGVQQRWISDEELDANPDLVKTMSVQPPRGSGKVRLISIGDIDLQPCGGTHVATTAEIGAVEICKIENKGKQNRRVRIRFAS
ncbi:MAG: alanyl-tRNA editing protein [Cohaesibacter sp.]|jgi:misacylated tRNA(Ala) deacylase|nr:alanyl-tRNA editing protein [Cohaesibacter sp.]